MESPMGGLPDAPGGTGANEVAVHEVVVEGSGLTLSVRTDETIFDAAKRQSISWPTICEGRAQCSRCYMKVLSGAENLSQMQEKERKALTELRGTESVSDGERLACQTKVTGPVVVYKRSVRMKGRSAS